MNFGCGDEFLDIKLTEQFLEKKLDLIKNKTFCSTNRL